MEIMEIIGFIVITLGAACGLILVISALRTKL